MKRGPQSDLALLGHIRARVARINEYTNRERSKFYGSHPVQSSIWQGTRSTCSADQ